MNEPSSITLSESTAQSASLDLAKLKTALTSVIFGQEELIDAVIVAVLARGNLLLEGLPGLGKTELVRSLSKALRLDSKRIQFTPDLLPGDITGNPMLEERDGSRDFVLQPGPVFTNLLLADEINRASPKTQSALLEAMQEGRVTVMGESHPLPQPFFVFATQNPIEIEGTYPLPEAQLDRFLFKLTVTRTSRETLERIVTERHLGADPRIDPVLDGTALARLIDLASAIHLPAVVVRYIARLVHGTYPGESKAAESVQYGASPRAAIAMAAAARARALIQGRTHASTDDVAAVALPVLNHRVTLNYESRLDGKTSAGLVAELLEEIDPSEKALPASLAAAKIR